MELQIILNVNTEQNDVAKVCELLASLSDLKAPVVAETIEKPVVKKASKRKEVVIVKPVEVKAEESKAEEVKAEAVVEDKCNFVKELEAMGVKEEEKPIEDDVLINLVKELLILNVKAEDIFAIFKDFNIKQSVQCPQSRRKEFVERLNALKNVAA